MQMKPMDFESGIKENAFGIGFPSDDDMISELPDIVLIHIMNFMDTKEAVRTCVLSKRWKNLCRRLTSLSFHRNLAPGGKRMRMKIFRKFVSWVLHKRDDSYSVFNLSINDWAESRHLDKLVKYAVNHDVQNLTLALDPGVGPYLKSLPLIFRCQTLTSLVLFNFIITLPKLHLPALKNLHLEQVQFTATGDDRAEPFSNCPMLETLFLAHFSLRDDAKVLCISNSTLSTLTIYANLQSSKIVLSTPHLASCSICGSRGFELSSECNLLFLREVNIITSSNPEYSIIMGWLQVFANVKTLILNVCAFQIILKELSKYISWRPKCQRPSFAILRPELRPPSFARLESLKVRNHPLVTRGKMNRFVQCLLQNSPMPKKFETTVIEAVLGWPPTRCKKGKYLRHDRWCRTLFTLI